MLLPPFVAPPDLTLNAMTPTDPGAPSGDSQPAETPLALEDYDAVPEGLPLEERGGGAARLDDWNASRRLVQS